MRQMIWSFFGQIYLSKLTKVCQLLYRILCYKHSITVKLLFFPLVNISWIYKEMLLNLCNQNILKALIWAIDVLAFHYDILGLLTILKSWTDYLLIISQSIWITAPEEMQSGIPSRPLLPSKSHLLGFSSTMILWYEQLEGAQSTSYFYDGICSWSEGRSLARGTSGRKNQNNTGSWSKWYFIAARLFTRILPDWLHTLQSNQINTPSLRKTSAFCHFSPSVISS